MVGTSRSSPHRTGPEWISEVRPGREHDSTAAIAAGLDTCFAELNAHDEARRLLVLVDLGFEKFAGADPVRMPHKKPKGKDLTVGQRQYNQALGALRALAEKANADLKMRFQALPGRAQPVADRGHRPRLSCGFPARTRPDRMNLTQRTDRLAEKASMYEGRSFLVRRPALFCSAVLVRVGSAEDPGCHDLFGPLDHGVGVDSEPWMAADLVL